jgi:uncharacterized protein (DUF58 family)
MLGAMLVVMLMGSINYDNALAYLMTFLLTGLFVIAMLQTYRNLVGLSFIGVRSTPVFAGDAAQFEITLDNRGGWHRYSLMFAPAQRQTWFARRRSNYDATVTTRLAAGQIATATIPVATSARGWLPMPRIKIWSRFPLGILQTWAYYTSDHRCLVYPRPAGSRPLPVALGESQTASRGATRGDDDFAGLRPYAPGDPTRAIAWKALARHEDVLVKRFTGGGEQRIRLRWADCETLTDIESRISQLTRWVIDADRNGAAYSLELPEESIPLGSGNRHREQTLTALALFKQR